MKKEFDEMPITIYAAAPSPVKPPNITETSNSTSKFCTRERLSQKGGGEAGSVGDCIRTNDKLLLIVVQQKRNLSDHF